MKPFLQVITENTCRWPVESHWCGEAILAGANYPYCQTHYARSLRKSTSHAEMVEMINTPVQHDTRPKHAKGNEAAVRSKAKNAAGWGGKSGYDFMAHAGGGE